MIEQLVAILEQTFKDLTSEEIADILWLTLQQWQSTVPTLPQSQPEVASRPQAALNADPPESRLAPPPPIPPSGTTSAARQPEMAGLTTIRPQAQSQSQQISGSEAPLAVPDAPALRSTLEILKALRPLIRRVASAQVTYLDVAATVQVIAETDLWLLKQKPVLEPWLELAIVVDATASMVIWQRMTGQTHLIQLKP